MKLRRKIIASILILLIAMKNESAQALYIYENAGGSSQQFVQGEPCKIGEIRDGCSTWSENLRVRIALVDKEMKIVYNEKGESTKSVEFTPYYPYRDENYGTYEIEKSEGVTDPETGNPLGLNQIMIPNQRHNVQMVNMYSVNYSHSNDLKGTPTKDQVSSTGYFVYMGFGDCTTDEECERINYEVYNHLNGKNDFSEYEQNRDAFIRFVKSHERKIIVETEDFFGKVSFVDFFLKVSGYADEWDYTLHHTLDELDKYYLMIEPVYVIGTHKNGYEHFYTATAKQLGNMIYNNNPQSLSWFLALTYFRAPKYNILCNFYDKTDFNNQNYRFGGQNKPTDLLNKYKYICDDPYSIDNLSLKEWSEILGWIDSPFGLNVIQVFDVPAVDLQKSPINVDVSSCTTNSFKYEFKVSGLDEAKFSAIYPKNMDPEKIDKYYYHIGENDNQLWCYDDILYDFSEVKQEFENANLTSGKLQNIPNGKLTVNRTCYAKTEVDPIYLNQVFQDDPGTYQNTFDFTFQNKKYTYTRQSTKYQNDSEIYNKTEVKNLTGTITLGYQYSSSFSYNYIIESLQNKSTKIGITDYSLSNSLKSTNSLKFNTSFDNPVMIKAPETDLTQVYTNELSVDMGNAYGLSNKLYNEMKAIATYDEKTNSYVAKQEISQISLENSLNRKTTVINYNEQTNNQCSLETAITRGIMNTDGLKFRIIDLDNPFPARDGTMRMPGENWINQTENNVYEYIQNNRGVDGNKLYTEKEPIYTITLDPTSMIKIREYNKTHSYGTYDIICEENTGRRCISNFLRNSDYNITGACKERVTVGNTDEYYSCADKTERSGG